MNAIILPHVDREEIERPGFPVGRRGYDQAAVDAHLRRVADELERMRGGTASLSAGTSEQVRVILEAAERSAAELSDDAGRRASEHVERVAEAADAMLRRIDELQAELGGLVDSLRTSGERLAEGLAALQESVAQVGPAPVAASDPGEPPVAEEEDFAAAAHQEDEAGAPAAAHQEDEAGAPAAAHQDDEAGARIIALNMALGGSPREETAAYLEEHFALADPEALLDDVYARAGG